MTIGWSISTSQMEVMNSDKGQTARVLHIQSERNQPTYICESIATLCEDGFPPNGGDIT